MITQQQKITSSTGVYPHRQALRPLPNADTQPGEEVDLLKTVVVATEEVELLLPHFGPEPGLAAFRPMPLSTTAKQVATDDR